MDQFNKTLKHTHNIYGFAQGMHIIFDKKHKSKPTTYIKFSIHKNNINTKQSTQ